VKRTVTRLAVLGCGALLVTSCSSGSTGDDTEAAAASTAPSPSVTILQPGKPGEPAATVSPGTSDLVTEEWSHADVAFMQMMVPHHAQALEMSRLARSRAEDGQVRAMAERIRAGQAPEILAMAAWLEERGMEVPRADEDPARYDHGAHGHSEMAGMLTQQEMGRLRAARGREFDRLFLRGMIAHHRGAIRMARDVQQEGTDVRVAEMAADVRAVQTAEIDRMRRLLADL
jgi:uncharacterized protein (DUF305 family)